VTKYFQKTILNFFKVRLFVENNWPKRHIISKRHQNCVNKAGMTL